MVKIACIAGLLLLMQSGPSQQHGIVPLLSMPMPIMTISMTRRCWRPWSMASPVSRRTCSSSATSSAWPTMPNKVKPERTLQSLYLDPLRQRVKANEGRVYRGGSRFLLFIDIKSAAEPTYQKLHETLAQYRDMLTSLWLCRGERMGRSWWSCRGTGRWS